VSNTDNSSWTRSFTIPAESAYGRWLADLIASSKDNFQKHLLFMYVVLRIPLVDCFYLADAMREEDLTLDEACYIAGNWEAA
jgi:hypothetical protein